MRDGNIYYTIAAVDSDTGGQGNNGPLLYRVLPKKKGNHSFVLFISNCRVRSGGNDQYLFSSFIYFNGSNDPITIIIFIFLPYNH